MKNTYNLRLFILIVPFVFFANLLCAQTKSDSLVTVYLAQAKEQISLKDYPSAHNYLKKIFSLKTTLPDEVAYYYGLTLVKMNNYTKGTEALEKYQQLTGDKGEFYEESQQLMAEAANYICKRCFNTGTAEITDTCTVCLGSGKLDEDCEVCKSRGVEFCVACAGKGVFISKENLGNRYLTCQKCNGKGFIECRQCHGTKKKSAYCSNCKGKGFFKRKEPCSH